VGNEARGRLRLRRERPPLPQHAEREAPRHVGVAVRVATTASLRFNEAESSNKEHHNRIPHHLRDNHVDDNSRNDPGTSLAEAIERFREETHQDFLRAVWSGKL